MYEKLQRILKMLSSAKQTNLGQFRCFVLPWSEFLECFDLCRQCDFIADENNQIAKNGFNNFGLAISVADKNTYWICTKSEVILDAVWKENKTEVL